MPDWYRILRNDAERVDIDIYGDIGEPYWDDETSTSAKQLLDLVRAARGKAIHLHVNSGGGSVFDAFAMMTALAEHDGKVTAHVDGIAASAASFLLAAADEVRMASVGYIMVHNASTAAWGDSGKIRETADWLDRIDAQLAGIYALRSGRDAEDFREAMAATTWFTAAEALEWGLVDAIDEVVAVAACATRDRCALGSAPDGARGLLARDIRRSMDSAGVGLEPAGQEPAAAQERAVAVDGLVYRVRETKKGA